MKLGVDNLLSGFDSGSRLNVDSVDTMRSWRMGVELVSSVSSVDFSLKKLIESIFFSTANVHWQVFDSNSASCVILNWQLFNLHTNIFWRGQKIDHLNKFWEKKITYLFVVDLDVTDPDSYGLIKLVTNLMINLLYSSRNNTPLLIVICQSKHGKCLSSTSLAVTHNSAIVPRHHTLNYRCSR